MKKTLLMLMVCALTMCALTALVEDRLLEPAEGDLTMEQAISIAKMQLASKLEEPITLDDLPMKATFLSLRIEGADTKIWIVPFFPSYPSSTVYAVTVESPTGIILHVGMGLSWNFEIVWEKWGREDYSFWSVEEKALFHEAFQLRPTRIMPDEDAIPQEQALEIALETIETEYGVPRGAIEPIYRVDYNYVPGWYASHYKDQADEAWLIMLRPPIPDEYLYQIVLSAKDGAVYACDCWAPEQAL